MRGIVQMAKPWKHPDTGAYYLYRQIPEPLRGEFGGRRVWKVSLRTKDAAEAARLYPSGIHAAKKLLFLASNYNTWSDGRGQGIFPSYRYSSVYAGAVYDLTEHVSVQLGGLAIVSGRNALRERGLYTGFWIRF